MKECCDYLYNLWKNCFKYTNKKIVQVEYTKMIPKNIQQKKINSEFFSPQSKEKKTTINFKETDASTNKLTIIEEEIIFPSKYLNVFESDPSFKFEFSKKNILSFLESEIEDKTSFKSLVNKDGFDIYIKETGSIFHKDFPMVKMFYKIPKSVFNNKDINIKIIDEYMNTPEKRLAWDTSLTDYKIIEKEKDDVYVLHYICKSPLPFMSQRDIVDKRFDFYENDVYYDFSSSVNDDFIPLEDDIVRITDHCSMYKISEEEDSFNIVSLTQMDTKYNLPNSLLSYQLPINYKKWYDSLINGINEDSQTNQE